MRVLSFAILCNYKFNGFVVAWTLLFNAVCHCNIKRLDDLCLWFVSCVLQTSTQSLTLQNWESVAPF